MLHPLQGSIARGGGGGLGPKSLCTKNRADKIFPMVNFVFPHDGHFGLEGGGPGGGGDPPSPTVYGHSNTSLSPAVHLQKGLLQTLLQPLIEPLKSRFHRIPSQETFQKACSTKQTLMHTAAHYWRSLNQTK